MKLKAKKSDNHALAVIPSSRLSESSMRARLVNLVESSIVSRQSLIAQYMDPRRDYDKECGYPTSVSKELYKRLYERMGIARRVVEVFPKECWSQRPELYETEDPEETEFELAWDKLQKQTNLWYHLHKLDVVSGIGRFGIMLLGFSDGKELYQPVGLASAPTTSSRRAARNSKPLELLYVRVLDESVVTVDDREADPSSPRFGQPTMYTISFEEEIRGGSVLKNRKVHWTRIIHVADNCLESEVFGKPRMEIAFDRLVDLKKVLGGGAEMFWRGAYPGLSFEAQQGITDADLDKDALRDEIENYSNGLQRVLSLVGMTAKTLPPQIADPTSTYEVLITDICITLGVPKRVFMGSEIGELASTQDATRWNDRLKGRCEEHVTPKVIRPTIERLIDVGVLPQPGEDGFTVAWPDRTSASKTEKASIAVQKTEALSKYVGGNVDQIIPPAEFLTQILEMDPKVVESIMEAAAEWQEDLEADKETEEGLGGTEEDGEETDGARRDEEELDPIAEKAAAKEKAAKKLGKKVAKKGGK